MLEKSSRKNQKVNTRLPLIRCECGAEILLIPDLKAMGAAIEEHALEHMNKQEDTTKAEAEGERIRELLIAQVLSKASET